MANRAFSAITFGDFALNFIKILVIIFLFVWKRGRNTEAALAVMKFVVVYFAVTWESCRTPLAPLADLKRVVLGGQPHFATFRSQISGRDLDRAPVLLKLHGGPGGTSIPSIRSTDRLLEERFIVVNYDQRSAGKSCRYHYFNSSDSDLSIRRHVEDARHMTEYLRGRFRKNKIYLLGESWGSYLAVLLARDYPNLYHHVAVRGLAADTMTSEILSNDFIKQKFPEFIPKGPPYGNRAEDMREQRSWLFRAGGSVHKCANGGCSRMGMTLRVARMILTSPEMSWYDIWRYEGCYMKTLERMWPEVESLNITAEVSFLDVPFLILHGRHDHNTAAVLVKPFFENLSLGPNGRKRLLWFQESAHSPQIEEPERFQEALIQVFLGSKK